LWGAGLARDAQQQRSKQAESGVQLRNVTREVHGREYNGFASTVQYFSED